MGDKFSGELAGGGRPNVNPIILPEAMENLNLHETLVAHDGTGKILLRCVQNPWTGGIMLTGESGEDNNAIYVEAIKKSQMTSMLADDSRCSRYANAILNLLQGKPEASVLDIGTGTGLLAILAAKSGAQRVEAFEMFQPMAELASKVVDSNGLSKKVRIHAKRSTDVSNGGQDDGVEEGEVVLDRCNVLVTEIFDSALLGEGCLSVIDHAHENLLQENALVIPAKATVLGVILESEFFERFHNLGDDFSFHRKLNGTNCTGGVKGIPIHWDAFTEGVDYKYLTDAFDVFNFDFSKQGIKQCRDRKITKQINRIAKGKANCVITWWKLDLDGKEDIVYSTKPGDENWQDHWVPVLYPLPSHGALQDDNKTITISIGHDDMTFWFAHGSGAGDYESCSCGYHILPGGPYRIFELSDGSKLERKRNAIKNALEQVPKEFLQENDSIRCIDLSDESVCSLLASSLEPTVDGSIRNVSIFSVEESNEINSFFYSQVAQRVCKQQNEVNIEFGPLAELLERETQDEVGNITRKSFNVILSEPYTRSMSGHPLATLSNLMIQIRALLSNRLVTQNFQVVPSLAKVYAKFVRFLPNTIQQSFKKINSVQDVDHSCFSDLFNTNLESESSQENSQRLSLPMFQYKHDAVSEKTEIFSCMLSQVEFTSQQNQSYIHISLTSNEEVPDAIALWVEYDDEEPCQVSRSELIWLNDIEKLRIHEKHGVSINCTVGEESNVLEVSLKLQE